MITLFAALCLSFATARAEMPAMADFEHKLSLGISSQPQSYTFELSGGKSLSYQPNMASMTVFSLNDAGVGGVSYSIRQNQSDSNSVKGRTEYQDLRFNFPFRRINVFAFYSRYKGFYISNSGSFDSTITADRPYITLPDLYAQNMGINLNWVWNPERFSLAAVMDFTEQQIKAGGSWLVGLAATETIFRNSGPMIPFQVKNEYKNDAEMYEGRVRAISVKGGYGYTEVYRRRWFTSVLGTVGVGPEEVRVSTATEDYSILRWGLVHTDIYVVAGFNGDRFFSGFNFYTSVAQYQAQDAQISTRMLTGGFFAGGRF